MFKKLIIICSSLLIVSCSTTNINTTSINSESINIIQPSFEDNLNTLVKEQYSITEDLESSTTQHYKQAALEFKLQPNFIINKAISAKKNYGSLEHWIILVKFDNSNSASNFFEILQFDYSVYYDNSWYSDVKNFYLINNYVILTNNKVYAETLLKIKN
jgi:hypothetical protein